MAYKALDCLVNSKVDTRYIELPISKLDIFGKLFNSIKYRFKYFIKF